ncbi:MAG: endonuclease III domain-containing protein [Candidatus Omnitrophota bacterium]|jgi:endonuclease-3 related protein
MSNPLNSWYQKLIAYFGLQHWWPADSPFEVIVGAVLTQNTNWQNVEKAINNLKKHKLLAADKLYKLKNRQLAPYIKSAGYYNIKAKRLKEFLKFFFQAYQGDLEKMSLTQAPNLRRQLLSVNGIGPETADSILLYAFNKPVFVVDAYTKRILIRHRMIKKDADYQQIQGFFLKNLKADSKLFNEYHALLVKLGKEFCLKNKPRCEICPLKR